VFTGCLPEKFYSPKVAIGRAQQKYSNALGLLTLQKLAQLLPQDARDHYRKHGFVRFSMELDLKSRRMLACLNRRAMVELGVDPTDANTYKHSHGLGGYDATYGWIRVPAFSQSQYFLVTHPRLYTWMVGLYAFSLLELGMESTTEAVAACIELRAQVYNSKLHFPSDKKETEFDHLDCNWKRPRIDIPAPQCFVATSPSVHDGTEVFRCKFVNLASRECRQHMANEAGEGHLPYTLPRADASGYDSATSSPNFVNFADATQAQSPEPLNVGDGVLFSHLAAHQFTQHKLPVTNPVPLEYTRCGEYPTLVSPLLHGVPNQSAAEVHIAMATAPPPLRWAHPYTGNRQGHRAGGHLRQLLPPTPVVAHTRLAQCLLGLCSWADSPDAVQWLVDACCAEDVQATLEKHMLVPMSEHLAMVAPAIEQCRIHLTRLAAVREESLENLLLAYKQYGGCATSSSLDAPRTQVIANAASAALADGSLWDADTSERQEWEGLHQLWMPALSAPLEAFNHLEAELSFCASEVDEEAGEVDGEVDAEVDGEVDGEVDAVPHRHGLSVPQQEWSPDHADSSDWKVRMVSRIARGDLLKLSYRKSNAEDWAKLPVQVKRKAVEMGGVVEILAGDPHTYGALGVDMAADPSGRAGKMLKEVMKLVAEVEIVERVPAERSGTKRNWYLLRDGHTVAQVAKQISPHELDT
jgi:hypothetical protein